MRRSYHIYIINIISLIFAGCSSERKVKPNQDKLAKSDSTKEEYKNLDKKEQTSEEISKTDSNINEEAKYKEDVTPKLESPIEDNTNVDNKFENKTVSNQNKEYTVNTDEDKKIDDDKNIVEDKKIDEDKNIVEVANDVENLGDTVGNKTLGSEIYKNDDEKNTESTNKNDEDSKEMGLIAKSDNVISNKQKEEILKELETELNGLFEDINSIEIISEEDLGL